MRKYLFYYFFFLLSLLTLLSSGIVDSQDGLQYLAVARNIYYTGKPTAPIYEYNTSQNIHMSTYIGKDGNTYSPTGLGFSLALVPAVTVTDIVYKIYDVSPSEHFPLESDWLILLCASFTNAFFGAALAVILLLYLINLKIPLRQAILLSFIGLFATNLLIYTKHIFTHMMFTTFLFASFYLLKRYSQSSKNIFIFLSGISFGIMMITYNNTFLLTVPPYVIYYFLLLKFRLNRISIKRIFYDLFFFVLGFLPFLVIYLGFENLRASGEAALSSPTFLAGFAKNTLLSVPLPVFFEGVYGQLLSPGRSIFIYSPILLLIIIFWHKIPPWAKPELFVFVLMLITYVGFYASIYSIGRPDQGIAALWHGESSWGPRYLIPIIPFGMIVVGSIYEKLSKNTKVFVVLPLVALGLYISLLGVILPYQIKFHNMNREFFINGTEYTSFSYINLLPRYSPIISMTKNLQYLISIFPNTFKKGEYNVRFYDGIDFPFNLGLERWRVIENKGYISFDNNSKNPVNKISLGLINHPIKEATYSAKINFYLNNSSLLNKPYDLALTKRTLIELPIQKDQLREKQNQLAIEVTYPNRPSFNDNPQILSIINFSINNKAINMEKIDVPYVSPLGLKMTKAIYQNYGGENKDPWKSWHIHTQIFERVPDFWWTKALYYWDLPKPLFVIMFILNLSALLFLTQKLIYWLRKY